MNISFFDGLILKIFSQVFGAISAIFSVIFIFIDIEDEYKKIALLTFIILLIIIYICIYIYAINLKSIDIKIDRVSLTVKYGDLFYQDGLKVIPVNEYFDTIIDNKIISTNTIHGKFILSNYPNSQCLSTLDTKIEECLRYIPYEENNNRPEGKNKIYPISTSIEITDEYILTAFTKYDKDNIPYLNNDDYLLFLHKFWNEINRINNGRVVNIPLLGTGLSRIMPNFTEQDFLEQLIWSIKTSNLTRTRCKINIIIYNDMKDCISIFRLKNNFK
ncbi:macro domain-containing protein [Paraclostridium bifermentans]|uniref:macro domain-containing protein n=1 Tax=Paraclostridium bifermentans TaxID=1490 RepID=UPI0034DF1C57